MHSGKNIKKVNKRYTEDDLKRKNAWGEGVLNFVSRISTWNEQGAC